MTRNRLSGGVVSLLVLITTAISFGGLEKTAPSNSPLPTPTAELKDTRNMSRYGVIDYSSGETSPAAERFLANRRYDKQGWVAPPPIPPEVGGLGRNSHDPLSPSLPINESSLIIVGEIVRAAAHLSNDKRGVYTEFTIRVNETVKNGSAAIDKTVLADRDGGVVVYPGDQKVLYQDSRVFLPLLGNTYLLFLTKDESPNYKIITAYELKNGQIHPMESRESGEDSKEFYEKGKKDFIRIVKEKIQQRPL